MSMSIILSTILVIFLEVLVGYIFTRRGLITEEKSRFLSTMVMEIFVPCMLIATGGTQVAEGTVGKMMLGAALLLFWYILSTAVCLFVSRRKGLNEGDEAVFVVAAALPNSAFLGIPLITALMGEDIGMVYAASSLIAFNIFFFTYNIRKFQGGGALDLRKFITPVNLCMVIMVAMLLSGFRLPQPVHKFASSVGACTTPVALIIVGSMLARSSVKKLVRDPFLYVTTFLKNLFFPGAFMVFLYLLRFDPQMSLGITILISCPAASFAAVAAGQYKKGELFAGRAIAHSTFFYLITGPFILAAAGRLFG